MTRDLVRKLKEARRHQKNHQTGRVVASCLKGSNTVTTSFELAVIYTLAIPRLECCPHQSP